MKVVTTGKTVHRLHGYVDSHGSFHATACSKVVTGGTAWYAPAQLMALKAHPVISRRRLCGVCFDRHVLEDMALGLDPVQEARAAQRRAYAEGETAYRATKAVKCDACGETGILDGEWATGHPIELTDPDRPLGVSSREFKDDGVGRSYYPTQDELIRIHQWACPRCGVQGS